MPLPYLRFQICGQGWPVNGGAMLIPAGTVVDYNTPRDTYSEVCWAGPVDPALRRTGARYDDL
jgi:hypothetical protein